MPCRTPTIWRRVDRHYIDEVAGPLLRGRTKDANAIERLGKRRTDRFRADVHRIVAIISQPRGSSR